MSLDHQLERPRSFWSKYWFVMLASVLILLIVATVSYQLWWGATRLPFVKHIENFTLENLSGEPFQFKELDGKVRLVSFIYTKCPDICPATSNVMATLQEELKKQGLFGTDVAFLSVTFDPQIDTAQVLDHYADAFHADRGGWYFLRGDESAIKQVTDQFGIGVEKLPDGSYLHTMRTFLVDKDKNVRKMYGMGAGMDINEIVSDIERLAKE
ncbi:SCO family protein [Brevibacillus ginsengisoli]|uniref:SCO family protein n=1 Tax=Brevibacillus ginsengisoli TaxID=363854 RepID=UPI003CE6B4C1